MDKLYTFSLAHVNEKTSESVSELKEILARLGIDVDLDGNILHIGYEQRDVEDKLSRRAGRKRKEVNVTVEQVQEMRKTMTIDEICNRANISRASFYRHFRCKEN